MPGILIERLAHPARARDLRALARILVETVESGDAVSFVRPLTLEQAEQWWRKTLAESHPKAVFLVAREGGEIVGTVQMHPAWAPNQPHRAEVVKLLVDHRRRGAGLGARLMHDIEEEARATGYRLLTLDAKRGGAAERLYRRMGWTYVGVIPNFAVNPDGQTFHDAVIFYRPLD
ncbi:MAG: GNAT family N-acetyltransferase [Planctomycetota bacterium]|nr:MAG: GNAT family N-acetyltransferase [Planctomycetota bacterium]